MTLDWGNRSTFSKVPGHMVKTPPNPAADAFRTAKESLSHLEKQLFETIGFGGKVEGGRDGVGVRVVTFIGGSKVAAQADALKKMQFPVHV